MTSAGGSFSVLVFDMAHSGEPDAERMVEGFSSLAAARAYARARIRASVEDLRAPGQSPAELRSLWYLYGEDCKVIGDTQESSDIDLYIATPATTEETGWVSLAPPGG